MVSDVMGGGIFCFLLGLTMMVKMQYTIPICLDVVQELLCLLWGIHGQEIR